VLAISADGHTIVASAPWHDSGGGALGIIYVYREPPTGWADMSETARLSLTPRSAMTTLGRAVAISGDGQTIVASAPDSVIGGALQSSTFVFVQPQLGWATTTAATAELRTTPDVPADGNTTVAIDQTGSIIAVGCRGGRTLIFQRPGLLWAGADPIAILSRSDPPPPPNTNESFMSIAISSDGGFIVMGIPLAQLLPAGSGTAYVYIKPAAGWATATESLRLTAPGMVRFGSVATIGGERRMIVIGTPTADSGSAIVFERPAVQIFAPLAAYERLIP
jgi:hypothetical protein